MAPTKQDELKDVKARLKNILSNSEIIACHEANIQIKIVRTKHKQCICQFQFSSEYPKTPMLFELKSKVFSEKVLKTMSQLVELELKKLVDRVQVVSICKFVNTFIQDNPLLVCADEISRVKKDIVQEQDEFKVKQKTGVVTYKIACKKYYLHVKLTVPDLYPTESVKVEFKGSNFPKLLETHFVAQAIEVARRCVEAPLKKNPKTPPFEPKPSLFPVLEYLGGESIHKFPTELCPYCKKQALNEDPEKNIKDEYADEFVEWIYCNHIYHHKCLDIYMKTPPFTGGKKCLKCGLRIYHDKWNISPELAEERWAHKEARKREIDEVTDFLDLM